MCCTGLYNEHIWVGLLVDSQIWPGLSTLSSLLWKLHPPIIGWDLLPVPGFLCQVSLRPGQIPYIPLNHSH